VERGKTSFHKVMVDYGVFNNTFVLNNTFLTTLESILVMI